MSAPNTAIGMQHKGALALKRPTKPRTHRRLKLRTSTHASTGVRRPTSAL